MHRFCENRGKGKNGLFKMSMKIRTYSNFKNSSFINYNSIAYA